ncbi:hypothetical protein AURDEDRAFT_130991 [Auricularia subglabra TFB-10046 SS5]|uniref:Uncharacterized protein n=1 Tax=Auricularia subglabra (strain TFB-10046 / SS5) TaxID=717982 RepID=J0LDM4_AURST|nr:hypothetical protein AURDEDRAFT_130991 [Auricularia subglabra TFB-10046 SS5]
MRITRVAALFSLIAAALAVLPSAGNPGIGVVQRQCKCPCNTFNLACNVRCQCRGELKELVQHVAKLAPSLRQSSFWHSRVNWHFAHLRRSHGFSQFLLQFTQPRFQQIGRSTSRRAFCRWRYGSLNAMRAFSLILCDKHGERMALVEPYPQLRGPVAQEERGESVPESVTSVRQQDEMGLEAGGSFL